MHGVLGVTAQNRVLLPVPVLKKTLRPVVV